MQYLFLLHLLAVSSHCSPRLILVPALFFSMMVSAPAIMDAEHFSPYRVDGKLVGPEEEILAERKAD